MKNYLVYDIGGTDIKYGVITDDLTFLHKNSMPSRAQIGGLAILEDIIRTAKNLIKEYQVSGLAVSSAGVINSNTGIVLSATDSIKDFIGLNIKQILENELNLLVSVENDVNSMALCESTYGAGKEFKKLACLTVGTGIGGGVVIDNEILKGSSFSAGEFGLMIINGDGYEKQASLSALVNQSKKVYPNIKNGIDVFTLYDQKDEKIVKIVNDFYNVLAIGIVNIIYVLNPEAVIIGGGITNRKELLDELTPFINKYLRKYESNHTVFKIAKFKNDSGMIGALAHFNNTYKI